MYSHCSSYVYMHMCMCMHIYASAENFKDFSARPGNFIPKGKSLTTHKQVKTIEKFVHPEVDQIT